jgi:hypothetical protein
MTQSEIAAGGSPFTSAEVETRGHSSTPAAVTLIESAQTVGADLPHSTAASIDADILEERSVDLPRILRADDFTPGHSNYTSTQAEAAVDMQPYQQTELAQSEGDLIKREGMVVIVAAEQACNDGDVQHGLPSPIGKLSKYSTGYLTRSGWYPIHKAAANVDSDDTDDLPGRLLMAKGITVPKVATDDAEFRAAADQIVQDAETPLEDAKYFDRDSYLEHVHFHVDEVTSLLDEQSLDKETIATSGKSNPLVQTRSKTKAKISLGPAPEADGKQAVKWELVNGIADTARIGQAEPEKLTIQLRNSATGEVVTYKLTTLSPHSINWTDKAHIQEISRWRTTIFRQHDIPPRRHNIAYLPEEVDYLLLLFKKIKAVVEAGHNVKIPGGVPITEEFNKFFVGKVLKDEHGADLPPREMREVLSIHSKLYHTNSGIPALRTVIRKLMETRHGGDVYVPIITEEELRRYQEDGTVELDDPQDEKKNASKAPGSPKRKREMKDAVDEEVKRIKLL